SSCRLRAARDGGEDVRGDRGDHGGEPGHGEEPSEPCTEQLRAADRAAAGLVARRTVDPRGSPTREEPRATEARGFRFGTGTWEATAHRGARCIPSRPGARRLLDFPGSEAVRRSWIRRRHGCAPEAMVEILTAGSSCACVWVLRQRSASRLSAMSAAGSLDGPWEMECP